MIMIHGDMVVIFVWKRRDDVDLIWWCSWPWWHRIFIFCIHIFLSNHKICHKLVHYQRSVHNYKWTCCGWFGESLRTSVLDRTHSTRPNFLEKQTVHCCFWILFHLATWSKTNLTAQTLSWYPAGVPWHAHFLCFHTIQYHDISIIPNSDLLRFFPSPSGWRQADMKNIKGKGYWMLMIYQGRVLWSGNFSCLLTLQWNWNC